MAGGGGGGTIWMPPGVPTPAPATATGTTAGYGGAAPWARPAFRTGEGALDDFGPGLLLLGGLVKVREDIQQLGDGYPQAEDQRQQRPVAIRHNLYFLA